MQKSNIFLTFSFVALFILLAPLCFSQKAKQYKIKKIITKPASDSAKNIPFTMLWFISLAMASHKSK
jgi:hypothetical protein